MNGNVLIVGSIILNVLSVALDDSGLLAMGLGLLTMGFAAYLE